jgi:hypothetical protein
LACKGFVVPEALHLDVLSMFPLILAVFILRRVAGDDLEVASITWFHQLAAGAVYTPDRYVRRVSAGPAETWSLPPTAYTLGADQGSAGAHIQCTL